ncbi:MAG TPA: DUF2167 domain-containing protein [Pyrinomonadaceae bacterium]|jgi:uncharacterized membrane-anchored protein|nr:DUF2167 domain-containing protein [Pyrinomonadaceae bacterium]
MKVRVFVALSVLCVCALMVVGQSKKRPSPTPSPTPSVWDTYQGVKWQKGPSVGQLGINAEVKIPEGYIFAGARDTRTIMEENQNPITNRELGFIASADENWFVVFEFDNVGYVKDDEKTSLDADAILESIKKGTEESNKERVRRGWPTMTTLGWETPPRYNETTHNLEWATRAESEGALVINHNTRLLGRDGVMEVTLVTNPETLAETLPKLRTMLQGFEFKEGHGYAEFRAGDKTAAYGLTGLIVGGATAALVKTGVFKWLWKVLVAAAVGVSALVKKLLSRNKSA